DAARYLAAFPTLGAALDLAPAGQGRTIVSQHDDEVRRVEQGYGDAQKPSDYLEGFAAYLHSHVNEVPALLAVTQRPRDLTRKALRELKLALDNAGYSEATIQTAWRQITNQDVAASIIGFIRQAALGDPLVPYVDRVDRAVKAILAKHAFTDPQ